MLNDFECKCREGTKYCQNNSKQHENCGMNKFRNIGQCDDSSYYKLKRRNMF